MTDSDAILQVAEQSLNAAEQGAEAVQKTISGMNVIRDSIQETSKRIKRLGESSQEIGEIVDLISGISEQTSVLALNAAIQAASAGEAGRGFDLAHDPSEALNVIHRALSNIEAVQAKPESWLYWRLGKLVAESIAREGSEIAPKASDLLERLCLRMGRNETGLAVDEELLRDCLFFLAHCSLATPEMEEVRTHYRLERLDQYSSAAWFLDDKPQQAWEEALAAIEAAKSAWLEYGHHEKHWYDRFNAARDPAFPGPQRLSGGHSEGRHRRPGTDAVDGSGPDSGGHRDAAHGRLRFDGKRAQQPRAGANSHHHDFVPYAAAVFVEGARSSGGYPVRMHAGFRCGRRSSTDRR